jgi:hypothetical protein
MTSNGFSRKREEKSAVNDYDLHLYVVRVFTAFCVFPPSLLALVGLRPVKVRFSVWAKHLPPLTAFDALR